MKNIKIAVRLGFGFASVLAMIVLAVAAGIFSLRSVNTAFLEAIEHNHRTALADEWEASTRLNINRVMALAKSKNDPAVAAHFAPLISATTTRINELQKELAEAITSDQGKALLAEISDRRERYIAVRKGFFEQLKSSDLAAAEVTLTTKLVPSAEAYLESMSALQKDQDSVTKSFVNLVGSTVNQSSLLLCVLAGLGVVAGIVAAFIITRSVTTPIKQAVQIVEQIAAGDLTLRVDNERRDEMGQMLNALARMQEALATVVNQIRAGTDSITLASGEIASGNQDLSSRTEQAASNLEETASSMEEITATVQQSADSAKQASQLASSATEAAKRGGAAVGKVIETMDAISQSSQKISDIISVIDGIAFQTNILALNAAVEAARAGEQGRGFAVVASEVRSLAQRSAQAAKEIKTLIVSSAEKVAEGSDLVNVAGGTMDGIVQSVQRVMEVIGEISTAAQEQRDGISQINAAVNQLDQMTQQNAALVEQSAAAAEGLKDQAQFLGKVVAVFKV